MNCTPSSRQSMQDIVLPHSEGSRMWKEHTVTVHLNNGKNSITYRSAAGEKGMLSNLK